MAEKIIIWVLFVWIIWGWATTCFKKSETMHPAKIGYYGV